MEDKLKLLKEREAEYPIVSVIIPTYNRAEFVGAAIASVLGQTFSRFELIVIDDGSSDATDQVIRSFHDPRLTFVRQENQGRSAARNRAIRMARGKYIAFLDSDDEYLQDKLFLQVTYMEAHPEVGMLYTSAQCINADGEPLEQHTYKADIEGDIYRDVAFFRPVTITLPTVMLRREVLEAAGLFDEAMERFEDTDLWRRIAKRFRVGVIERSTCRLRTHPENELASQNPDRITAAIEYYVDKIFREDVDIDTAFLKRGASGLFEYYGKAFLTVPGWRRRGIQLLGRAIFLFPARAAHIMIAGTGLVVRSVAQHGFMLHRSG